jgi:hypothetical protein
MVSVLYQISRTAVWRRVYCRVEMPEMLVTGFVKNIAAAIALILILTDCAKHPWGHDVDPNMLACQGYGFYDGTPEFDECMKYVKESRDKKAFW